MADFDHDIGARVEVLRDGHPDDADHGPGGHRLAGADVRTATVDNQKHAHGLHYLVDVDDAGRFWVNERATRAIDGDSEVSP